ncbi:hypothetical protein CBER1_11312 [Cercospora berteroae]|uniref:BTB domain-containing protein n=1 Tax=Cercospora berteroae TaxID=357750 RepID=A0A2S6BZF7_9PEZI|nr:hypothetical protein CBER1_11312 [Cercospora berteroae]
MSAAQLPTNKQQPFKDYLCPHPDNTGELYNFQSITASPAHSHHSAEELRLQDYYSARRPIFGRDRSKMGEALKLTKEESSSGSGKYRGPVILVVVGTNSVETFAIHKQLLAAKSEFVRLALQGNWREAKAGVISLPDDDPKTFEVYQAWLYDRKIYTDLWVDGIHDKESRQLMNAWVLGDKLLDTDFKDALMDALVGRLRDTQAFAGLRLATSFIYSKTPDGSAPRRLLTDIYTYHGASWWVDEVMHSGLQETYAVDFLKDLSKRQLTQRGPSILNSAAYMAAKTSCAYHDHKPGKCFRVTIFH